MLSSLRPSTKLAAIGDRLMERVSATVTSQIVEPEGPCGSAKQTRPARRFYSEINSNCLLVAVPAPRRFRLPHEMPPDRRVAPVSCSAAFCLRPPYWAPRGRVTKLEAREDPWPCSGCQ